MEGDSYPSLNLTEKDLRDAGASAKYIAYYRSAKRLDISTSSTNHAEKVINRGVSYSGGSFHETLWKGIPRWSGDNPYGADETNQKILRGADI